MKREHFISPQALENRLGEENLSIICNFMYLPTENRDGAGEYAQERIPGAVYFDLDRIAEQSTLLPHMIAQPQQFARQMGELGISEHDDIVVYDGPGLFSSARIWWNLRLMGATNVRILEGGYNGWKEQKRPIDYSPTLKPEAKKFTADFDASMVVNAAQVLTQSNGKIGVILDARSKARFDGDGAEPRKGLRLGHIPGSVNLPFTDLLEDGKLIDNNALKKILEPTVSNKDSIVTTCGSGVTAAVISLALTCAGYDDHALFDGSWTQWGDPEANYPVVRKET